MNKNMYENSLFLDFPPATTADWLDKIKEDLKGTPFEKLVWKAAEDFYINPFYRQENITDLDYLNAAPGTFPFVRSGKTYTNNWDIRQDVYVTDIPTANSDALHALNHGAGALCFKFPEQFIITSQLLKDLLKNICIDCINLNFVSPGNEELIVDFLAEEILTNNIDPCKINGSVGFDPLGTLASKGYFHDSEEKDFSRLRNLLVKASDKLPLFRVCLINGNIFHNAGGTSLQELALSLSCASEYLDRLTGNDISVDQLAKSFQINMTAGPLYFMEIAKFRTARLLFANLIRAWNPLKDESANVFIHASTSEWNQTIFDPYVNMLRGTTEGMSAALGGVDSLTVIPFGKSFRNNTAFGERIARNTQIILKEEAYFDKVIDPAAGSYYIEKITDSLAEHAWNLFMLIENEGGFAASLKSGYIQSMLKETAGKRDLKIATRKEILVGTNQYPDHSEAPNFDFENSVAFPRESLPDTLIADPLKRYRGAMAFEELRIRTHNAKNGKPKIFLLNYGNVKWYTARSAFSFNFFGCVGYEIIQSPEFNSVREGIDAALATGSSIIVLCSSDDQYPVIAPEAKDLIGDRAILVIAGYPKDTADLLKSAGIEHFIHTNSNVLEELRKFHHLLGIDK